MALKFEADATMLCSEPLYIWGKYHKLVYYPNATAYIIAFSPFGLLCFHLCLFGTSLTLIL